MGARAFCSDLRLVVLDPRKKLEWFSYNSWPQNEQDDAKRLVFSEWEDFYKPNPAPICVATPTLACSATGPQLDFDITKYTSLSQPQKPLPSTSSDLFDSLQRYLAEPLVSEQEISDAGGLLAYLESQRTQ